MTHSETAMDHPVLWGAHAGLGPGYTLEAAAVRLADTIGEWRHDGGIPPDVRTVITVFPHQRLLEIRVEGLPAEDGPDHTTREVLTTLFELASDHNIVALDDTAPPLFTQRIVIVGSDGRSVAALVGTAIGKVSSASPARHAEP